MACTDRPDVVASALANRLNTDEVVTARRTTLCDSAATSGVFRSARTARARYIYIRADVAITRLFIHSPITLTNAPPYAAKRCLSAPFQSGPRCFLISLFGPKSTVNTSPECGQAFWSPLIHFVFALAMYIWSRFLPGVSEQFATIIRASNGHAPCVVDPSSQLVQDTLDLLPKTTKVGFPIAASLMTTRPVYPPNQIMTHLQSMGS